MTADRVVATYRLASFLPLEQAASVLAGEQSSGTFTKVPLESAALIEAHGATVLGIDPIDPIDPGSLSPLPGAVRPDGSRDMHVGDVRVSFPVGNFGPSVSALLTTVAGNLFEIRELATVKLLDVDIPTSIRQRYEGPRWGIEGTRDLTGNHESALIGTIVKPSVGLGLDQLATLVRSLALAEIDFIKDDELNTNLPSAPLADRIRVVMHELDEAAQRTGKRSMYAFNITDDLDAMKRSLDLISELGGSCAMVAIPWVGLSTLADLRRHSDLVLHGHRAGFGALDRSPALGISFTVFQKLARLCGADHLHVGGVNGKFWESNEVVAANARSLTAPIAEVAPALPVLSSAQTAATAAATHDLLRSPDLLVLAGGGIHAHPGGVAAGVESLRSAWRAVLKGEDPRTVAVPGSPLAVALATFDGTS